MEKKKENLERHRANPSNANDAAVEKKELTHS